MYTNINESGVIKLMKELLSSIVSLLIYVLINNYVFPLNRKIYIGIIVYILIFILVNIIADLVYKIYKSMRKNTQ